MYKLYVLLLLLPCIVKGGPLQERFLPSKSGREPLFKNEMFPFRSPPL